MSTIIILENALNDSTNDVVSLAVYEASRNTLLKMRQKLPKAKQLNFYISDEKREIDYTPQRGVIHGARRPASYIVAMPVTTCFEVLNILQKELDLQNRYQGD